MSAAIVRMLLDLRAELAELRTQNEVPRNNYAGGGVPGVGDDSADGYSVGSLWLYSNDMYVCVDASAGAASWKKITP